MKSSLLAVLAMAPLSPAPLQKPVFPVTVDIDPGPQLWQEGDFFLFQTVARWAKRDLTYSFHGVPEAHQQLLYTAYAQAARMWSDVSPLTFRQVESNGDIEIWWVTADQPASVIPGVLSPVPGGGQAGAEFPNKDQPIRQVLNGELAPDWSTEFATRVATHELGHSLGLLHADDNSDGDSLCNGDADSPIMCSFVFSEQTDQGPALHQTDIAAIQLLYGSPEAPLGINPVFPPLSDPPDSPAPPDENDPDGDGLDTFTERLLTWPTGLKCDPNDPDTDGDGLSDGYEVQNLLDPTNPDSDGDGLNDAWEIARALDPRSYVVVTESGIVVAREGVPVCMLPVVGETRLKVGLTTNDFLRAGFAFGDTVTLTAKSTGGQESVIENVVITQWATETGCTLWMTGDLQAALGYPAQPFAELLIEKEEHDASVLRITHPEDGDFVPQETDLIARIQGVGLEGVYVQFFVLAPDPWRFYPQTVDGQMNTEAATATFARARVIFGGPDDDGRAFSVWAELRTEPAAIIEGGVVGLPPVCEPPCLMRSPTVQYTRGTRDSDDNCVSDADEIGNGAVSDAFDPNVPYETPEPESRGDIGSIDDPDIWWWAPEATPSLDPREDGAIWLRVEWTLAETDSEWVNISRRFEPPLQAAYCQKIEADIQALGPQRIKVELKVPDGKGGFKWVRTETYAFAAEEYKTVVVDLPESEECIELAEVVFTIDRLHDNPQNGTYWIRDVRVRGRPSLDCVADHSPEPNGPCVCGALGMLWLPMTMLATLAMQSSRRNAYASYRQRLWRQFRKESPV